MSMVIENVLSPTKMVQNWDKIRYVDIKCDLQADSQNPAEGLYIKGSLEEKEEGGNWTVIGQPVTADKTADNG